MPLRLPTVRQELRAIRIGPLSIACQVPSEFSNPPAMEAMQILLYEYEALASVNDQLGTFMAGKTSMPADQTFWQFIKYHLSKSQSKSVQAIALPAAGLGRARGKRAYWM